MKKLKNFIEFLNEKKDDTDELRICIVGDILMNDGLNKELLVNIEPITSVADICIGNIEVTDLDNLDRYVKVLKDIGFTHLSICNNHSMDNEIIGLQQANDIISRNIKLLQRESKLQLKSFRLNLVNFTTEVDNYTNKEYIDHLTSLEFEKVDTQDINIAYIHWRGREDRWPSKDQRSLATLLSNRGYNIIIGTGPHLTQRVEVSGEKIKSYSLGDFNGKEGKILILDFKNEYINNIMVYNTRLRKGIIEIKNREIL